MSQQPDVQPGDGDESFKLVETWKVDHVQMREDKRIHLGNNFSISQSGIIGISCTERPSLSVDVIQEQINHLLYYQTKHIYQLHLSRFLTRNTWPQRVKLMVVYIYGILSLKRPRKSLIRSCPVNSFTKA